MKNQNKKDTEKFSIRRAICLILGLSLLLGSIPGAGTVFAASSPKLNLTKKTLEVGESVQLSVKGTKKTVK